MGDGAEVHPDSDVPGLFRRPLVVHDSLPRNNSLRSGEPRCLAVHGDAGETWDSRWRHTIATLGFARSPAVGFSRHSASSAPPTLLHRPPSAAQPLTPLLRNAYFSNARRLTPASPAHWRNNYSFSTFVPSMSPQISSFRPQKPLLRMFAFATHCNRAVHFVGIPRAGNTADQVDRSSIAPALVDILRDWCGIFNVMATTAPPIEYI